MAAVIVGLARRQIRPQRQHRLGALQGLNLGLLIQAQDHRVGRRIQVQTDHIADLRLGLRIGGELESLDPMGLQLLTPAFRKLIAATHSTRYRTKTDQRCTIAEHKLVDLSLRPCRCRRTVTPL
jgi:hypothetical protein